MFKKSFIKPASTYVHSYLIYVEGSPECGGIFFGAGYPPIARRSELAESQQAGGLSGPIQSREGGS